MAARADLAEGEAAGIALAVAMFHGALAAVTLRSEATAGSADRARTHQAAVGRQALVLGAAAGEVDAVEEGVVVAGVGVDER